MKADLIFLTDAPAEYPWAPVRYLRRLVAERRIPFYKRGSRILLDPRDIEALAVEVPQRTGGGR
jgi:excisionase family DNA binding protein